MFYFLKTLKKEGVPDIRGMLKLAWLLKGDCIPFEMQLLNDDRIGIRIVIPSSKAWNEFDLNRLSMVCHTGSYGHCDGLIEAYAPGLNEGVEGWLTPENALHYARMTYSGIPMGSRG